MAAWSGTLKGVPSLCCWARVRCEECFRGWLAIPSNCLRRNPDARIAYGKVFHRFGGAFALSVPSRKPRAAIVIAAPIRASDVRNGFGAAHASREGPRLRGEGKPILERSLPVVILWKCLRPLKMSGPNRPHAWLRR